MSERAGGMVDKATTEGNEDEEELYYARRAQEELHLARAAKGHAARTIHLECNNQDGLHR